MKTFKLVKEKNSFQIHWEKKSINEKRDEKGNEYLEIEGYASTKDRDRGGDVVEPQAFEKAIKGYMTNPIVLLQHKHDKPIGVVTDAKVDNNGLYIKANITENTDNVMSAIRNGVLRTFSIGYWLKEGDYEVNEFIDDNGVADYTTTIKNLELYEISVVSVPMNAYALMKSIEDCFEVEEVKEETEENKETEEEKTETVETEISNETENQENDSQEVENAENEWKENTEKSLTNEEEKEEENIEEEVVGETEEKVEENNQEIKEDVVEEKEQEGETEKVVEEQEEENQNAINDNSDKEVAENANIESSEVVENSENVSETETNGSETNSVEVKTMEGISQKSFQIGEKELEEMIEKRLEAKLLVKEKEVENLKTELVKLKDVLKTTIQVLGEMDGAVRNTVIKTGATYSQVAKRQTARSDVVRQAQKSL